MRDRLRTVFGPAALLLCLASGEASGQQTENANRQLALVGGTIYVTPTAAPILDGIILIRDGLIEAVGRRESISIPTGVETLDCSGATITAGFWNSHVHFMERKWSGAATIPAPELAEQLVDMLTRYGCTSVFDTGSNGENTRRIRDRIESGEIPGPRIRTTGEILAPTGGSPAAQTLDALGFMRNGSIEVADGPAALEAARKNLDAGADGIKLYAATFFPPFATMPPEAIRAAVDEAHRRGKPAFAHPTSRAGLMAAALGGIDVVVHTTPQSRSWDEEVLSAMKQRGVAVIPTLKLWRYELHHDRASSGERLAKAAIEELRAWLGVGGAVLFGTDVGYMGDYDPSDEYAAMAEAGMSFGQILASLTTAPAERFGATQRLGRLEQGLAADLVVIDGDPTHNPPGLAAVRYTIRDGALIYSAVE